MCEITFCEQQTIFVGKILEKESKFHYSNSSFIRPFRNLNLSF